MRRHAAFVALLCLMISTTSVAEDVSDPSVFQVTFGTRPAPGVQSPVTDSAKFLVETANGDILVAGVGASSFTDTGRHTKPMLTRIDRSGTVIYRRIFEGFDNDKVSALLADEQGEYLVLSRSPTRDSADDQSPYDRISIYRIDARGSLSAPVAAISGLNQPDITSLSGNGTTGILVAGIPAERLSVAQTRGLDFALHELTTHGRRRQLPFPVGIKGVRELHSVERGGVVFRRAESNHSQANEVVHVDRHGTLTQLANDGIPAASSTTLFASMRQLFLISRAENKSVYADVRALTLSGQRIWDYRFNQVDGRVQAQAMRDGGVLLASSYQDNPVVVRLDSTGHEQWSRSFVSAKNMAYITRAVELRDGWLALAGTTSPGRAAFGSTDSDALLIATDAQGEGLKGYRGCRADAAELERLRRNLEASAGIIVHRATLMSGRRPKPAEALPPLNQKFAISDQCEPVSEQDFLAFMQEATEVAAGLNLSRPDTSTPVSVVIHAQTVAAIPTGLSEWANRGNGRSPSLIAGHRSAGEAIRYIATELVPFIEPMHQAAKDVQTISGMRMHLSSHFSRDGTRPRYRELANVTAGIVDQLSDLDDIKRATIRKMYDGDRFAVSTDSALLHGWGNPRLRVFIVGAERTGDLIPYMLDILPAQLAQIKTQTATLQRDLNISIDKSDPYLSHDDYIASMTNILASADQLTREHTERIRGTDTDLSVGDNWVSDLGLDGRHRQVHIRPAGAEHLLRFLLEHADELDRQEARRD